MAGRRSQAGRFGDVFRSSFGRPKRTARSTAPTGLGSIAYDWDLARDRLDWGPNAAEVLGLPADAVPGTGEAFARLVEPGSGPDRRAAILAPEARGDAASYEARYALRLESDRVCWVEDSGRFFADADGRPALARGLLRIHAGAFEAPGTVKARSALLARIRADVLDTRDSRHRVTLIVGLLETDASATRMAEVERAIRPLLRRGDHFAPYAPDRFALALMSCAAQDAPNALARLTRLVEGRSSGLGEDLRLGAACAPDHAADPVELLARAEEALEAALSRSLRFAIHGERPARPAACGTSPFLVIDALNGRRLTFARRPVADALTGNPVLHEVLPRLVAEDGALAPAQDLAAAMAEAGLSLLLDGRMLELAAGHLAAHPKERLILPIAPATFRDGEWLDMLAAHLGARSGIASRLMIALPGGALRDVEAARGRLDAMKALGIGLAAQGFGTGRVTGRHLRHLPLDLLRIDGSLVKALTRSPDERLFMRSLIDMARRSGMATLAEWVEDGATARMLAAWGVDYLQGGLFREGPLDSARPDLRRARSA